MELNIYTDGAARGNPGPAGFGLVIALNSQVIFQQSQFLGTKTNNEAEYHGLIAALRWLKTNLSRYHPDKINFYSDSKLMVEQIKGLYKVKAKNLQPLHQLCQNLLSQINTPVVFQHLFRRHNQLADSLANQAIDQQT